MHNRHRLVKDAIESVFLQKPPSAKASLEIIVVDDGSVPPLSLRQYLPRIKLIHTANNGVSAARNAGVRASKGRYLAFLDSDDLWLPDKLHIQLNAMKDCPLSYTDEFWYRPGRWVNQGRQHEKHGGDVFCKILDKCRVSPSSFMISRDLYETLGGFNEKLRVCEDYDFFIRAANLTEFCYINKKLIVKRAVAEDSLSAGIKHIESIRLGILESFIADAELNGERRQCALAELERKRAIVKY